MNKSSASILSSLKGSNIAGKKEIQIQKSKSSVSLLNLLYKNGYISGYKLIGYKFKVYLKYSKEFPNIRTIKFFSTPSRRSYISYKKLLEFFSLNDFIIVSTNLGFMSLIDAFQLKKGGQLICKIN